MGPYNIVLVDDHAMFREGIRRIIEQIKGFVISGEANNCLELLELMKKSSPDMVILDISSPNICEIKKLYPHAKVLVLTVHRNKWFIQQALSSGADGILLKEDPSSELIRAVQIIKRGGKYLSPLLSSSLIKWTIEEDTLDDLTSREREILKLLAQGKKVKEIAETLFISANTVRRHRYNIMGKLHINNIVGLVKYAISQDYISGNA